MTHSSERGPGIEAVESKAEKKRVFKFIPRIWDEGANAEKDGRPIKIVVVGEAEMELSKTKELLNKAVAETAAKHMAEIQLEGKIVLWNMASGKTFDWASFLPAAFEKYRVDPDKIIVMVKEDAWNREGKHMPPGDSLDFRGKRIESFHKLFQIKPKNVTIGSEHTVSGNLLAPDYDMSPETAVNYMNSTWDALTRREDVETYTTSGIGEDTHVGEMQINNQGFAKSREQRDFFLLSREDYSHARGHFKWVEDAENFRANGNVFVELQEDGEFEPAGRAHEYHDFGTVVGIGWNAMVKTEGGATLVFDSPKKAFPARMALEGSFSGRILDDKGIEVGTVTKDEGEGEQVWPDLLQFAQGLETEGIIPAGMAQSLFESKALGRTNDLLSEIYKGYEAKKILTKNEVERKKYFEPVWRLVNRYIGKRSPVSRQIQMMAEKGVPIELVMTAQAATELPLQ